MKHQETIDYVLKVVWQNMANRYNQIAAEHGITQSIGYLLMNIDESEGTTVSEVASLLGLKATSLSRMLNNLNDQGLISRQTQTNDKRSVKIFLTQKGKEKRLVARSVVKNFNEYLNGHLPEKDKKILVDLLNQINNLTINYKPEN